MDKSFFGKKCFVNEIIDTRIKILPNTATIDDQAGKSKRKETFKPKKLPKKLTIIAIMTTPLFEWASIMAQTDGIIK